MAQLLENVISLISKPPASRSDVDISNSLSWLRRHTELLPQLDSETQMELLRFCSYETSERDDIIVRQGEVGSNMYIILRGSISVYIDATLTGEDPDPALSPTNSPSRPPADDSPDATSRRRKHALERAHYGKFIIKYEAGKCFGEAALVGEDKTRNASIIADKDCDFLVIDEQLFDRCLKTFQEKEFREKHKFVASHPFFSHMSPKFKRLLQLSLRRENFAFDTPIVTQGEKCTAMYFILSGQAKIYIEPSRHQKQYNHLWPFEVGTDIYAQEFAWLRESRKNAILRKYEDPSLLSTKRDSLVIRRQEGYAACERMLHERQVCLCSVQDGEVIGDAEIVQNLSTYMQTVVCTTNTQVLVLHVKNLERVTGKRNMQTMQIVKQHVRSKMDTRRGSKYGQQVPLMQFLYTKLSEKTLPENKKLPPLKTTKALPSRETQIQHMLERYLDGKAELVEPCVPGTLIYKDLMEEKTRIRENIRRRGTLVVSARRKINRRKPRSRREIMESLKEMMEAELVEIKTDQAEQQKETKRRASLAAGSQGESNSLPPVKSSDAGNTSPTKGASSRKSSPTSDTPPRRPSLTNETAPKKSSLTKDSTPKDPAKKKRVTLPPLDNNKADSKETAGSVNPLLAAGLDGKRHSQAGSLGDPALPMIKDEKEGTALTQKEDTALPQKEETPVAQTSASPSSADSSRYVKREVQAERNSPSGGSTKRLPPLTKVELHHPEHVPGESWDQALQFVNERIHDRLTTQLLESGAELKDYETSEGSLQLLESRIKQFHVKYSDYSPIKLNLKLPKLRRFKMDIEDENQSLPKPGGKVWIKKRICQFANSKLKVKGHQHIRYHMVPELPDFDSVKKMQRVMQRIMDKKVTRSQEQDAAAGAGPPDPTRSSEHRASFV